MSFLDSLENNLKALEGTEKAGLEDHKRRESERRSAVAAAPWADELKKSAYTQALMQQATRAGYQLRTKVNLTWIGTTLRLDARNQRLELRPAADGVNVVYLKGADEVKRQTINLKGKPDEILREWIPMLEQQKKEDDAAAAAHPPDE